MFRPSLRAALVAALLASSTGALHALAEPVLPAAIVSSVDEAARDAMGTVDALSATGPARIVEEFEVDDTRYALLMDSAMSERAVDVRMTVVRVGDGQVILQETASEVITAVDVQQPRTHLIPGNSITEGPGYVVCVKQDPIFVQDEACVARRDAAIVAANLICATGPFVGPVFGAIVCATAQLAVSRIECLPVLVTPPPVCQRFYPEPAEPAVKEAENRTGQQRPHPCETPGGSRNPACDEHES